MKIRLTVFALLLATTSFSQSIHRCATVNAIQLRDAETPGYASAVNRTFEKAKEIATRKETNAGVVYQVPVVVHIVYNSPEENIPNGLVYAQIARLNRDYRKMNADTTDTRTEFKPVAADAEIEFYLAGTDPDGNPTGGITRTQTSRADFAPDFFGNGLDDVKQSSLEGVDSWDTDNYLNIWVCDLVGGNPLFQLFGFAYPPATAPNWPAGSAATSPELEGVVIHYEVFGDGNPLATGALSVSDKGRTAVHEIGHYLGLRHIWGDANVFLGEDGCTVDDGIDDTPNAADNAAQVCNFNKNTCTDTPTDVPDMIENYMDYAQDQCMNLFTQGQVDIMRSMLETARTELVDGSVAPSSIDERVSADQIAVFPNPAKDVVQIQLPTEIEVENILLLDINGRTIRFFPINRFIQSTVVNLDVPAGSYLLQLQNAEGLVNKRVVVY